MVYTYDQGFSQDEKTGSPKQKLGFKINVLDRFQCSKNNAESKFWYQKYNVDDLFLCD